MKTDLPPANIPFIADHDYLPKYYNVSKPRLKNLTKRVKCNEILKEYNELILEYKEYNFCDYVKNGNIEGVLKTVSVP